MPVPKTGLRCDLLDVERFIRANGLLECTNPIMLERNGQPTTDGVLSNTIFGITQESRRNTFAYIDLHGHYMHPLAALKLASYDRRLSDALFSLRTFKLTSDGDLVEDPEGEAGPEFVYKIWGKIKVKDKETVITKEVQRFYSQDKNKLFITKYPVIPPFYRDINQHTNSFTKSSNILNSKYSNIISYVQTMQGYSNAFPSMSRLTQARVQTLLVDIYKELMVSKVKGSPSKFGMLRRSLGGKNLPYTSRLVITAANLNQESYDRMPVKIGYVAVPLEYVCSMFLPFMIHHLKAYFDSLFIQGGKIEVLDPKTGQMTTTTVTESFDENQITSMINKFINSPTTRFDKVMSPPDVEGIQRPLMVTGRYHKEQTSFTRAATYTDILYIVALRVVEDKHVMITRYPLDNTNGQFPARITISTTVKTKPVQIGDQVYPFYPVIEGDPANVFLETAQFSNTMLGPMGGDSGISPRGRCNSDVVRITQ